MRDTRACRACLNTEGKLETIPDSWYRLFENLTGVQVSKTDGYPNYFCVECKSHMNKALAFRKKSRRAFFVLKEIMLVKKEVILADILTVDRSRVNLKSMLGVWNPNSAGSYTFVELPEDPSVFYKNELKVIDSATVIDVKGDIGEFTLKEEVEPDQPDPEPDVQVEDIEDFDQGDDNFGNDDQELESQEPQMEIDMEDVFKGLKEPESDKSDEEVEDPFEDEFKAKKSDKGEMYIEDKKYSVSAMARAVSDCVIKKLTVDEQKEAFQIRLNNPDFKKAMYTCGICVDVYVDYENLMIHFSTHMHKKNGALLCDICKDKFIDEDKLKIHNIESHLYKYTCRICNENLYALKEVFRHKKEQHYENKLIESMNNESDLREKFSLIPVPEEEKVETLKKLSSSGRFTCDTCATSFATRAKLSEHVTRHLRTPTLKIDSKKRLCKICDIICNNSDRWQEHMDKFHKYIYRCKTCSYEAQNQPLALYHFERVHNSGQCDLCDTKLKSADGLSTHLVLKHWNEVYKHHCVMCGLANPSEYRLYLHQLKEHAVLHINEPPSEDAQFACKPCNVQFLSEKAYKTHLLQAGHEEAQDLPWKCLPCRRLFDSEEESKEHADSDCKLVFPGPCKLCSEVVVNNYKEYMKHCRSAHPNYTSVLNKRKLCDSCGRTYISKCSCKMPKQNVQEAKPKEPKVKKGKYKCASCDIVFDKSEGIILHVLKAHMKRPYTCNICSKTYKKRYQCRDHIMKIHAPVRPYVCPVCDREFSHLDFLKKHAKKIHDVQVDLEVKSKNIKDFYLYPNMKVDLSLIDKRIIEDTKVLVADYTDQIFEEIQDYRDYIITSDDIKKMMHEENVAALKRPKYEIIKLELKQKFKEEFSKELI